MKLALVHDWIVGFGGAERVLLELHRMWPDAPIYTLLAHPSTVRTWFSDATIVTSWLGRIPAAHRIYPLLAPFMPFAVESFDLSDFDTVISSSVIFSKGIVVRPDTRHYCYCYSPSRPVWDRAAAYERSGVLSTMYRHMLRTWDFSAAQRPDQMIASSQTVSGRIAKYYRRSSLVIPPPSRPPGTPDTCRVPDGEYFLVVARLVPHKSLDLLIDAFSKLRYHLVVVGDGPQRTRLMRRASDRTVFTGWIPDDELDGLYGGCKAVIVPNDEDWGLTAVEAMSHGKPVLALRRGGVTETVLEGITGEFFDDPIPEAVADGVKRIIAASGRYDASAIKVHAAQYGREQFRQRMRTLIEPAV